MLRTIRYHLDEHASHAIARGLRRRGIDVSMAVEVGLTGVPDPVQLAHATAQGRILFTLDEDFLALHGQGVLHAGIAFCYQGTRTIGRIISGLELLWLIYEAHEMIGRVEYL
jgi:hypothetical protein